MQRGIESGPIHTFQGWKKLGRAVKKGERAIRLCMPVTMKRKRSASDPNAGQDEPEGHDPPATFTKFLYKLYWFVLSQTNGELYLPAELPEWQEHRALEGLGIRRVPFHRPGGNCQGFALDRQVAVSPIAFLPHRTLFHELGHVVLGHTEELRVSTTRRNERRVASPRWKRRRWP
jgi:hypothetical protein